ncbi:MAG TPA: hypothetical protein VGZ22_04140 [Isosphaeraceae bacterium]|jgi:nucleotidyltransferase/DNA polymerase involved in DNA repair|nr:hypothetical protein [Isosphaeraceae bacterium]
MKSLWLEDFSYPLSPAPGRVVTRLPLTELWDGAGKLRSIRVRDVGARDITDLLRIWSAHFLVAEVGRTLRWVSPSHRYSFWRAELRPHLVEPAHEMTRIADFPGHYCYLASEWHSEDGEILVVLEKFT